jgi:hypothetical protein
MNWENRVLETFRAEFHDNIFHTKDAFNLLKARKRYSKGTVYRVLHDLVKTGMVERLGRGIYRVHVHEVPITDRMTLSDRVVVKLIPGSSKIARKSLRDKGIEFMITGAPLFYHYIHNLPKRLMELVYVTKGAGELAVFTLREAGLRALLNPTSKEISLALENFPERDFFIVREFSELLGNIDGMASLERALVDLYFEATRGKTPFPEEEVGRIFLRVLKNEPISHSRLLMFASRRGIKKEIEAVLEFLGPGAPSTVRTANKHARNFLRIIEMEERR